jgi:hypothetical protein
MNYSIIQVEKTNGNRIDGSWAGRLGPNKGEPTTIAEATEVAQQWEVYNRNLVEYAVVASVKAPTDKADHPPLPYGKLFTNLARLDKPRKKKVYKPISFKGKFRCVFTDPPKTAGNYNIAILDENNKVKYFTPSIRHDGKSWQMMESNYVTESSRAYWVEMA